MSEETSNEHTPDEETPSEQPMVVFHRYNIDNGNMSSILLDGETQQTVTTAEEENAYPSPNFILDWLRNNSSLSTRNALDMVIISSLLNPATLPPNEAFWEPVKVGLTLEQGEQVPLSTISEADCCWICTENKTLWRTLPCSDQHVVCHDCFIKWFSESVKCPFCKQDVRDLISA